MGIGTSLGAYYDNEHHYASANWNDKYDNNVLDPDILNPEDATSSDADVIDPVTKTLDFQTEL